MHTVEKLVKYKHIAISLAVGCIHNRIRTATANGCIPIRVEKL